jgi:hypothetical protein
MTALKPRGARRRELSERAVTERTCRTCGKPFRSTRGRVFCSRACWPSEPEPREDLVEIREQIVKAIERGESSAINALALAKVDRVLARDGNGHRDAPRIVGATRKRT